MMLSSEAPRFPSLKESADQASTEAQTTFLRLNVAQLLLLSVVALLAGVDSKVELHKQWASWAIAGLMFLALGISTALKIGRFDDRWFRCRAYAENFKSSVWRYVMSGDTMEPAEARYVAEIASIKERLPDLQNDLAKFDVSGVLITDWMQSVKALPVDEKRRLYMEWRIEDQIRWYSSKARFNARREQIWLWVIISVEFLAVLIAFVQANKLYELNVTGGIAAMGTAFVAWTQIKRFSDLDTSYSIAAEDLRLLAESAQRASSQAELDSLVAGVEKAVSREHTMWLKRRVRGI